jgi:hypothetical protein
MNRKDKKQQIRELAEEASNAGKSNNPEQKLTQKDLIKELHGNNVVVVKHNKSDLIDNDDDNNDSFSDTDTNSDSEKEEKDDMPEFKENVVKFVKLDDLIRQKQDEIKGLKENKKPYEDFILGYLQNKDAPFVNIKSGKLIKNKSESKAPLKLEIIKESIAEGIKNEKNLTSINEVKCNDITEKIIDLMNQKRGKSCRTNLKRTFVREKKAKLVKTKNKKEEKEEREEKD